MSVSNVLGNYRTTVLLDMTAYGLEQRRSVRSMLRHLQPGSRLLDVGCGFGGPSADAATHFAVQACDVRPTASDHQLFVEAVMRARSIPFQWVEAGLLPYAESTFDGVLLHAVLEHVRDKKALLTECRRVLRPGGVVFVFRAVNRHAFAEKLAALLGIVNHGQDTVTATELQQAVSAAELKVVRMGYHGWLPERYLPRWPVFCLNLILTRVPILNLFSHDYWLVAQR